MRRIMSGVAVLVFGVAVALLLVRATGERRPRDRRARASGAVAQMQTVEPPSDAANERQPSEDSPSLATGPPPIVEVAARYLGEINAAARWRQALIVGRMVYELKPQGARDAMRAIYRDIDDVEKRKLILKAFVLDEGYPYALDILDLAATDPEMEVRSWAFVYLQKYALIDFSGEPSAYETWRRQYGNLPLAETLSGSLRAFADRLRGADDEAYREAMCMFRRPDEVIYKHAGVEVSAVLQEAGMATWLAERLSREPLDGQRGAEELAREGTLTWLILADPDGGAARPYIESVLGNPASRSLASAIGALGAIRQPWAFDALLGVLKRLPPDELLPHTVGMAFAQQGDQRAVPWLIAAIASGETHAKTYGLGRSGLGKLTGVTYDESHDAKWWLEWWDQHSGDFAPEIRRLDPRTLDLGTR